MSPEDITDLMTAVETTRVLDDERKRALNSLLVKLSFPPLQFRPAWDGSYVTDGGRWCYDGAGLVVLHLVTHNPDRWVGLREGITLDAWRMAAKRAAMHLAGVDGHLAKVLAPAGTANAVGVRFRMHGGQVQVKWRPPPGRAVAVGVLLPFV